MVFRIASLTKQFTAVAVLMLAEQGKLAVDDTITKFLPDYPANGHVITVEHLLRHLGFHDNSLVLYQRGLKSAEALLMSRFLMYPSVYTHHVGRIAGAMFVNALETAIDSGTLNPFDLQLLDDYEVNVLMRKMEGYAGEIIRRLNQRELFKRALYVGFDSVDRSIVRYTNARREIETDIARIAGILRYAETSGLDLKGEDPDLATLGTPAELDLIKFLLIFPETVESCALGHEPHRLAEYLHQVAGLFHRFYHECRVVTDDTRLSLARLALCSATRIVLRNGLTILGVAAPDSM